MDRPRRSREEYGEPDGRILTGAMMLAHLGLSGEAAKIEAPSGCRARKRRRRSDVGGGWARANAGNGYGSGRRRDDEKGR